MGRTMVLFTKKNTGLVNTNTLIGLQCLCIHFIVCVCKCTSLHYMITRLLKCSRSLRPTSQDIRFVNHGIILMLFRFTRANLSCNCLLLAIVALIVIIVFSCVPSLINDRFKSGTEWIEAYCKTVSFFPLCMQSAIPNFQNWTGYTVVPLILIAKKHKTFSNFW